jgi:hypothetical protein
LILFSKSMMHFAYTLPAVRDPSGSFIFRIFARRILLKFLLRAVEPQESPLPAVHSATEKGCSSSTS